MAPCPTRWAALRESTSAPRVTRTPEPSIVRLDQPLLPGVFQAGHGVTWPERADGPSTDRQLVLRDIDAQQQVSEPREIQLKGISEPARVVSVSWR